MGWQNRVRFGEGFAYAPGQAIVIGLNEDQLAALREEFEVESSRLSVEQSRGAVAVDLVSGLPEDPMPFIRALKLRAIEAQPNHILFADSCDCCCGPHPAAYIGGQGNPVWANPVWANPVWANPVWANPVWANPVWANPVWANPVWANPVWANPSHANPVWAHAAWDSRGDRARFIATGMRRSTAKPAARPDGWTPVPTEDKPAISVWVLDTGYSESGFRPDFVPTHLASTDDDLPDRILDGQLNADGFLDPVAGHGTFIAGLVERVAPGCEVTVNRVVHPEGDVTESDLIVALYRVAEAAPQLLNLSLSGYAFEKMAALEAAIMAVQEAGTLVVASAGNDGICRPTYPASLPGVVSVGAIGPDGPAPFSNYGPWVRACAPGVNVVSTFFNRFVGDEQPPTAGADDPDDFDGWANWSGTSFSAPIVVGALARAMADYGLSAEEAVARVIDEPSLMRIANLGTVVNVR